jgi:magnesium-transporting ATPase (P-type)
VPTAASEAPDSSLAYRQRVDDLIASLGTDQRQGLNDEDARSRLERYGHNELTAEKPVPAWRRFRRSLPFAMSAADATVLRRGERRSIPATDIVPGDIILIEEGTRFLRMRG